MSKILKAPKAPTKPAISKSSVQRKRSAISKAPDKRVAHTPKKPGKTELSIPAFSILPKHPKKR